eukprot:15485400-Alexandrium_andersonii.AAC.1
MDDVSAIRNTGNVSHMPPLDTLPGARTRDADPGDFKLDTVAGADPDSKFLFGRDQTKGALKRTGNGQGCGGG